VLPGESNNHHSFLEYFTDSNLHQISLQASECRGMCFGREQGIYQGNVLNRQQAQKHNRIPNI